MVWKRCLQRLLFKVYEKYNYWVVHFLSTQFLSHVNTVCGLHWKSFKKFWTADGDSYANRGKNKLSLIRPTHDTLPGPLWSHIPPLGFSLGFMALHVIPLSCSFLSPPFCVSVSSPHFFLSLNLVTTSLYPPHFFFCSRSLLRLINRTLAKFGFSFS